MATLGNSTLGFTFSVSGSYGDIAGGPYTVPSPGIIITGIHVYYGNNGSSTNGRLYVWQDSGGHAGSWLARSGLISPLGGIGWQYRTDISFSSAQVIPGGTVIWIGAYSSSGIENMQGASSGTTDLGYTADGNFSLSGTAGGGMGVLGAYVDYVLAGGGSVWDGSAWQSGGYVWDGSAWQLGSRTWDGTQWVDN